MHLPSVAPHVSNDELSLRKLGYILTEGELGFLWLVLEELGDFFWQSEKNHSARLIEGLELAGYGVFGQLEDITLVIDSEIEIKCSDWLLPTDGGQLIV